MKLYGLIGYPLEHSVSPDFFRRKFEEEDIHDADYRLFPIKEITELPRLVAEHPGLLLQKMRVIKTRSAKFERKACPVAKKNDKL